MNPTSTSRATTATINARTGLVSQPGGFTERERLKADKSVSDEFVRDVPVYESPAAKIKRKADESEARRMAESARRSAAVDAAKSVIEARRTSGEQLTETDLWQVVRAKRDVHAYGLAGAEPALLANIIRSKYAEAKFVAFERERVYSEEDQADSPLRFTIKAVVLDSERRPIGDFYAEEGRVEETDQAQETRQLLRSVIRRDGNSESEHTFRVDVGDLLDVEKSVAWMPAPVVETVAEAIPVPQPVPEAMPVPQPVPEAMPVFTDSYPISVTRRRTMAERLLGRHPEPTIEMVSQAELLERSNRERHYLRQQNGGGERVGR